MWRFKELLPVYDSHHIVTLGEGGKPSLKLNQLGPKLGLNNLYIKDEALNPTGSFKARGLAVAVARAAELGVQKVAMPSAGNAAGAVPVVWG